MWGLWCVSYRRRTERGKVLWRCATRIEKGKYECALSPTLNEKWLKEQLPALICDGTYDEGVVKRKVDRIEVYDGHVLIKGYDGTSMKQRNLLDKVLFTLRICYNLYVKKRARIQFKNICINSG